jgi:uncharacterized repeat protein (TIGR03803 family)
VIQDAKGNLYGTAAEGGNMSCYDGCGVVFKVSKTGRETVLYAFTGKADGAYPLAGLIQDAEGNLYGTTGSGGDLSCAGTYGGQGCGVVFKLTP